MKLSRGLLGAVVVLEACTPLVASNRGDAGDAGDAAAVDVGTDIGIDIGSDVGSDSGGDVGSDVGSDGGFDVGMDLGIDGGSDSGAEVGADAAEDAGLDVPPFRCVTNADCADGGSGAVCDGVSGRCVECVASSDTCPAGRYCVEATQRCTDGCRNDEGCAPGASDGGVAGAARCNVATHACVACVTDSHCPAGNLCMGNMCVAGCSPSQACASGQTCCAGGCVDATSNVANCGGCGAVCMAANGTAACVGGSCGVGACTAPFADCDGAAGNGCEVDTATSAAHCGACGRACAPANATGVCRGGACAVGSCATGFADCDGMAANGCEVDTRGSVANCGGCGTACTVANGTAACVSGACAVGTCAAGFADCDGSAVNGCEVDTRGSVANCGGCGTTCAVPINGSASCNAGACGIACGTGFHSCDATCVDNTAPATCGASCTPCVVRANAIATCAANVCGFTCNTGSGDCDGVASNGCETNLTTTVTACGQCGTACTVLNGTPECRMGACAVAMCNAGFEDCDGTAANGCEADLTDLRSCGSCGTQCQPSDRCIAGACNPSAWVPTLDSAGRARHAAVWTGSEMLVWGGTTSEGAPGFRNPGFRYEPDQDDWSAIPTIGAPQARDQMGAVWSGSELIVWGGLGPSGEFGDGGRYNPSTNRWQPMTSTAAPSVRMLVTTVWTGSEMVVWGGYMSDGNPDGISFNSGGRYNPVLDQWRPTSTTGAPLRRHAHTAVWTGTEMIVWGGGYADAMGTTGDGGRYDPRTDTWRPVATAGAPRSRVYHTAVWTGSEMIVWGGRQHSNFFIDGGRYDPRTDTWRPLSTAMAPGGRISHTAIWTGTEMIVWGGNSGTSAFNSGAAYSPQSDAWRPLPSPGQPSPRVNHSAVWTGREMIVFGGSSIPVGAALGSGARYQELRAWPAPRQIAPLSTATVTSQRPTLRWSLGTTWDGARVQICRDRACATVEQTIDVTGTSAVLGSALSPGVHFWRLSGRVGATVFPVTSPTWEFFVGHRSSPVDTSCGSVADFNGDGYADVVVGAHFVMSETGRAYIYFGSAGGIPTTPTTILTGPDGTGGQFGEGLASAGDVNGDGYSDLIVGANKVMGNTGRAYIYLGSASGLPSTPTTTLTGPDGTGGRFGYVAGPGDINGDGYADIVVGSPFVATGTGRAYVYFGGPRGPVPAPSVTLSGTGVGGDLFGGSITGTGDLNGDGFADFAIGAAGGPGAVGRVLVFHGGISTAATPTVTLANPGGGVGNFGNDVASAGDVNGDGFADLVIGAPTSLSTGRAHVYLGSAGGIGTTPTTTLPGLDGGGLGHSVASAGDINGDGYADIVVGAPAVTSYTGRAYVYLGSASGTSTMPATTLSGPDGVNGSFGYSVTSAGDVSGDGYADLIVGAPNDGLNPGRSYFYPGSASGVLAIPTTTLTGPDGANGQFGYSVAENGGFGRSSSGIEHSSDFFFGQTYPCMLQGNGVRSICLVIAANPTVHPQGLL